VRGAWAGADWEVKSGTAQAGCLGDNERKTVADSLRTLCLDQLLFRVVCGPRRRVVLTGKAAGMVRDGASMAEPKNAPDLTMGRPATEFPGSTFPTAFADGVLSFVPSPQLVKFYLYRLDPNMFGRGGSVPNPFAQVIMPMAGFLQSTVFLQQQIERMIAHGTITQKQLDDAKALYGTPKPETGNAR
jgi:hypothetical protein